MYVKILVFWDVMSYRLIIFTSISKNFIVFILQGEMGQDSPWNVLPGGEGTVTAYQLAQHNIPKYFKL